MDFGGFILFGFGLLALIGSSLYVSVLFLERSPIRRAGLRILAAGAVFMMIFARYLYQTYWLDEALYGAAYSGDVAQVRSLLAAGANPNVEWEPGRTATGAARVANHPEIVTILEKAGGHD